MEPSDEGNILNRKPPSILYHYCSTETFSTIVKDMTLRFSELSVSNDSMEGRLAKAALIQSCLRKQMPLEFIDILRNNKDFDDHWLGSSLGLCLSAEDDLLSQWRGYADDGYGFSIGFSTELLASIKKPIPIAYTEQEHAQKVETVANKMREMWSADLQYTLSLQGNEAGKFFIERAIQKENSGTASSKLEDEHIEFYNQLFELSTVGFHLKGLAFSEEKEWRLLSTEYDRKCHSFARDRITPHKIYNLTPEHFCHVIIGPNNRTPPTVVRSLLHPNLRVTRSKATYRS